MTATLPRHQPSVRVVLDQLGRGSRTRAVRRLFPMDPESGCFNELQTAYLDHEHGLCSYNAQVAVLDDLRFLDRWCKMKRQRDENWVPPEHRAAADKAPLTQREVEDFGRWCQRNARSIEKEIEAAKSNVSYLPSDDVVGTPYRNRRLRNASKYLQWLTTSLATGDEDDVQEVALTEVRKRKIESWFEKQLLPEPKASDPASLRPEEADAFHQVMHDENLFSNDATRSRDNLILQLLDQGLRAGEVLKLRVSDVNDAYQLDRGRSRAIVTVVRRANDIDDERVIEPAVKTNPGMLPIPSRLASALIRYVLDERRAAIDSRPDGLETPYLFVNQQGRFIGRPLGQRNLNRIVAKLKGRFGLPESFVPCTLRHTHMTELYDSLLAKGLKGKEIQERMVPRGRWAPNSNMPSHYAARSLMREAAEYVEERDRKLKHA